MAKGVGPSEGCFNVLCTRAEGTDTGTNKGRGQGAAGEAETEDAGGKVFILLVSGIFHFLNI